MYIIWQKRTEKSLLTSRAFSLRQRRMSAPHPMWGISLVNTGHVTWILASDWSEPIWGISHIYEQPQMKIYITRLYDSDSGGPFDVDSGLGTEWKVLCLWASGKLHCTVMAQCGSMGERETLPINGAFNILKWTYLDFCFTFNIICVSLTVFWHWWRWVSFHCQIVNWFLHLSCVILCWCVWLQLNACNLKCPVGERWGFPNFSESYWHGILASDWSWLITKPEPCPIIGQHRSHDLYTCLWLLVMWP